MIFGENSFAKLKTGILDIAKSSLGDVVEMLEAHGLKVSEVVAAANKLIPIITGEDVTVDNLLGDLLGQNDFVLNVYIMQNSNRPLLDVINEMIQAPEGEEFTVAMLEEFIDTVGESNLYSFIDDLLGVGEINGKSFEEFVSGIVQSVLDSLSVTVETDNIGIVKSVSVSLGEVAVKNLFEAAITDFTIITGYVSDVDYNGFINEVKELSGGIRLTKNIIDQIFPDAEKTYYGSIKQVIVEKIEHDEKIEGKDENYYTKYITTRTRIETYSFEPNLMMDLYSDCGNWYRVELVCKYYCVEEYSEVAKRYENGELVDEREVGKSVMKTVIRIRYRLCTIRRSISTKSSTSNHLLTAVTSITTLKTSRSLKMLSVATPNGVKDISIATSAADATYYISATDIMKKPGTSFLT